jgi:hypothetical protein
MLTARLALSRQYVSKVRSTASNQWSAMEKVFTWAIGLEYKQCHLQLIQLRVGWGRGKQRDLFNGE